VFTWGSPKTTHSFLWNCLLRSQLPARMTAWAGSSIKYKPLLLLVLILLRFQSACFSSLFWSSQQEPCLTVQACSSRWLLLTDLLGVPHCPLLIMIRKTINNIGLMTDPYCSTPLRSVSHLGFVQRSQLSEPGSPATFPPSLSLNPFVTDLVLKEV